MIRRIMVPLAFSPYSAGVLNYAAELAGVTDAELIIVNVIHSRDMEAVSKISSYGYDLDVQHYVDTVKQERRAELKKLLQEMTLADDKVSFFFCIGDPATRLIEMALEYEVDTVVMGVKTKDIRHIFTGSVAEQMFRKCPVNLISVREEELRNRLTKKFLRHHKEQKQRKTGE